MFGGTLGSVADKIISVFSEKAEKEIELEENRIKEGRLNAKEISGYTEGISTLRCPECNAKAELKSSLEFYGRDYGTNLWVCPCCPDIYVGTKGNSCVPLGVLGDSETRLYRKELNNAKKILNDNKWMSKEQFNERLSLLLNMPPNESYIGFLTKKQCKHLLDKINLFVYNKKYKDIFDQF